MMIWWTVIEGEFEGAVYLSNSKTIESPRGADLVEIALLSPPSGNSHNFKILNVLIYLRSSHGVYLIVPKFSRLNY
jgi:hypothetical protein